MAIAEASRTARVLVFTVDDGCFCMHLDWVEAVYQRDDAPLHSLKDDGGVTRRFLLHRGQPALLVDLREAFGLTELLGMTDRAAFMVVRAGSFLLAVHVDACLGVRDLDLGTKIPVAAGLIRDGGLSVGHLVDLDGKMHGLLEPSRILSSSLREHLEPVMQEALAFRDRQLKIAALVDALRREPSVTTLKTYARLSRRNGYPRAAAATRLVLRALQDAEQHVNGSTEIGGDLAAETLLRDLLSLSGARQTGELTVQPAGDTPATIYFDNGRIADTFWAGEWGRGAFKRIVATREGSYRFVPRDMPVQPQRITDATLWLLVETVDQLSEERRGRQARHAA